MSPDKLVRMANQIATFFSSQPGEDKVERVAAHLNGFLGPGDALGTEAIREGGA
jgi:formate dehydrogenase subunit delta